ncbi:MAG: hypothetical protein Q8934_15865 [Bacillota bacterium]|nr:hypothetical protein [Bacillota bacterium]
MKKTINKKVYDTEKSKLLVKYSNGLASNDINYVFENLFMTEEGKFFLHTGKGAIAKGNKTNALETIIPLTTSDAYQWLRNHKKSADISNLIDFGIEPISKKDLNRTKKAKAVGYVSVKKKFANGREHKMVLEGFKRLCEINNWELVKIYEDKTSSPLGPRKEMGKLFREVKFNKNTDIEYTIHYTFGKYLVTKMGNNSESIII